MEPLTYLERPGRLHVSCPLGRPTHAVITYTGSLVVDGQAIEEPSPYECRLGQGDHLVVAETVSAHLRQLGTLHPAWWVGAGTLLGTVAGLAVDGQVGVVLAALVSGCGVVGAWRVGR